MEINTRYLTKKNLESTADIASQDKFRDLSFMALVAIEAVLVVGSLSVGLMPLLVDGFVRLAHLDGQSAGLCITAEMAGQSVGAISAFAVGRRFTTRRIVWLSLIFICLGNGLTVLSPSFPLLLLVRAVAGVGCGMTVVCIGLLAQARHAERNSAVYNAATILICGLLAATAPIFYQAIGAMGIFAILAGAPMLCLLVVPAIPRKISRKEDLPMSSPPIRSSALVSIMSTAYIIGIIMFWSYAGQGPAAQKMSLEAFSFAVSRAWVVGGLGGCAAAMLFARKLPHSVSLVISIIGTSIFTWCAVFITNSELVEIVLGGFVFCWFFSFPVQMGVFSQADSTGRLAVLAFIFQLIASALGPAIGGAILQVTTFGAMMLVCQGAYAIFLCAAFTLIHLRPKAIASNLSEERGGRVGLNRDRQ